MSVLDIRIKQEEISEIRFAENNFGGFRQACRIVEGVSSTCDESSFILIREEQSGDFLRVHGKEHAVNLIKALEKSIELGWLD